MAEKKIEILLVDDDEATRTVYAEVFRKHGFEVEEAIDGVEGLDKATKNTPDVIFTGIIMPRMDGFALIEALKKNVATSNVPVVISSHMGREEDKNKAKEMGAKDFITRDFVTPNEAVERVLAIFTAEEYRIKFSPNEMDAPKLAKDMNFKENFQCPNCGGQLALVVKMKDAKTKEYSAKFICPQCSQAQN
jgi:CheY-like chemotaxis protein